MHKVVAPAIQLERGSWRAFVEFEKAGVKRVIIRDFLHGFGAKRPAHFLLKRLGKKPVDVVIAVVHKDKAAVLHIPPKMVTFSSRKVHQFMPTQIAKRRFKQVVTAQLHHALFVVNRNRGVFHQRMQQVDRHPLIGIPVSGGVLNAGKNERLHTVDECTLTLLCW